MLISLVSIAMFPCVALLILSLVNVSVLGHEYYNGLCPNWTPMQAFSWDAFEGEWRAAFKMNSRSSCIRYTFSRENGQK